MAYFAKLNERFNFGVDEILIPFFSKLLRVIIVVVIFSAIAGEFNYNVAGLVGGLGLGGLAFALAVRMHSVIFLEESSSLQKNLLQLEIGFTPSVEGTVETITFRSTKI